MRESRTSPPTDANDLGSAAEHWRDLVERRARQMDAAYALLNRTSADYWQRRMANPISILRRQAGADDLVLRIVLESIDATSTVLDVGAGAGRYAIALAPHVASVIAVEPDAAMIPALEQATEQAGAHNITVVPAKWEAAKVTAAGLVLCAHVLYPIADVVPFIRRLDEHALNTCVVALRETVEEPEPLGRLWEQFHGEQRFLQPGYAEAFDVLMELGIHANVFVRKAPSQTFAYADLDAAVDAIREHLILAQTPDTDGSIREALASTLVRDEGGLLRLPAKAAYTAVLWWEK